MSLTVVPGEEVGVTEEYVPDVNVSEDNGVLRATVIGIVEKDDTNHVVRVRRVGNQLNLPIKGDLVYGLVTDVKPKMVSLDIVSIGEKPLANPFIGLLPVSMIDERRVETAETLFVPGDVIVCRVVNDRPPYVVTTKGSDLGVIMAKCRECGADLYANGDALVCLQGHHRDQRKVSLRFRLTTQVQPPPLDRYRMSGPRSDSRRRGQTGGRRYGDRRKKFG